MFKQLAAVLGATVLTTAAAAVLTTTTASAAGQCQLDRPCTALSYSSATATVTARIHVGTRDDDFYQVRWSITRPGGQVQSFPQKRVGNGHSDATDTFGPIAAADRSATITASIQSCSSGVFGSDCSPWEVETIVPLPYGPDTCKSGYVWRDAFAGDHVCVTTDRRDQAARDNAAAASRVDPRGAYGPQSCKQGYVWRVARPSDLVCVTTDTRSQTAQENAAGPSHRV